MSDWMQASIALGAMATGFPLALMVVGISEMESSSDERERRRVDRDSVRFQRMLQRYERRVGRRFSDGGPVGFGEMPLVQDRVPWR